MTVHVITYDVNTGVILDDRHEVNHDYTPRNNELVDPAGCEDGIQGKRVDVDADPPELIIDPEADWQLPGVIDSDTRDIISEQYRVAGANAIQADNAIQANDTIPQEVKDMNRATIQLFYLLYVALTGDRIDVVENEYFPL